MKLTLILIAFCTMQAMAGANAQTVTLKADNKEIGKVLSAIQKQGRFRFIFNSRLSDLSQKVSVEFKNSDINSVMSQLFTNTSLIYAVLENNLVAIRSGKPEEADILVNGRVINDAGEPVSSASITVKGSNTGTSSGIDGAFSITVPENAVLIISAVGHNPTEISVNGRQQLTITLVRSSKKMDEVVVIGYGTANKRDLTGSIVKIDGKEIADKPNVNPVASLQGKVAGLSVTPSAGIGKAPDIRIRGTNSIGDEAVRPVYVVDGILNDNIDFLNPNDIESIEILKDPSSLAIFGVRGAAGAIAVTTKKAKAGQVMVNFNSSVGQKQLVDKIDVLTNGDDFKTLYLEENANIGVTNNFDFTNWNGNTDWIDAVTQKGMFNNNNLSVTASSDKNRFYAGVGYTNEEGIVVHEQLKKYLFNMSNEYRFNKSFKVGVTFNTTRTESPNDGTSTLETARRIAPVVSAGTTPYRMKLYNDTMNYNLYSALPSIQNTLQNPLVTRENTWDKYIGREQRYVGSLYAEVNFLKDFNFRIAFYGDQSYVSSRTYNPIYAAYDPDAGTAFLVSRTTSVAQSEERWAKYQSDYLLNYKKKIGGHNIQGTAGWTTYASSYRGTSGRVAQRDGQPAIPDDKRFWYLNNGFTDVATATASSGQWDRNTLSLLLRGIYNYNNKYYLNATFRRDGSSLIYNPDQRWQNFWAIGAGWELTKEAFMSNVSSIDYLKLKGSIGVLGSQNTYGVNYPYFPTLTAGNTAVFGSSVFPSYVNTYEVDPNLRWETVHGREIGVEFGLLKNKLTGEINYYNRLTKDMLSYLNNGPSRTLGNFGSISNKGIEASLKYDGTISKDLSYSISGNITTFKNKVEKFGTFLAAGESTPNQTEVGFPIGYFYGYVVEGVYQSYADKIASPIVVGYDYGPGDLKYKDLDGDGFITTTDRTLIGNPTPDFTYGASFAVNYKRLDIGIDLQGSYGAEVYRVWGSSELPYSRYNYASFKMDRWHGEGTSNWVPRLGDKFAINRLPSTFGIEDGSYLRIRNIQVGYNFSTDMLAKAHIKSLRLFANVQNLKTFKRNSGYSPEFGGSPTSFGVDWGNGPIPMVYTAGINVNF
ncbi:MAG: TonB-dependent receptor [Ferruginibacter sp.]